MTLASIQIFLRAVGNKYLNIPLTLGKVSADRRFLVVDQRGRCRIVWSLVGGNKIKITKRSVQGVLRDLV
jgi:hypothetical protein